MTFISISRLAVLSLWLGAALFFGAVVAPAVFSVLRAFDLPNANEIAGSIITRTLSVVNISGCLIALLLLLTLFVSRTSRFALIIETACIAIMLLTTAVGHWVIAARMRALRAAMYLPIDQVPIDDPRRISFSSLHVYSVNALGLAMIAALITIVLIGRGLRN
ncbi:MAG: hypothetical protein C5B55_06370 [Blastocatellia bacterium]|nr:MAG: hypothetical protein C5B55_06370 [Blastocatellia bacterium]